MATRPEGAVVALQARRLIQHLLLARRARVDALPVFIARTANLPQAERRRGNHQCEPLNYTNKPSPEPLHSSPCSDANQQRLCSHDFRPSHVAAEDLFAR